MPNTSLRRPQKGYARRGGKQAYHGAGGGRTRTFAATTRAEATSADERAERTLLAHQIDESMGFARFESGRRKEGWLVGVQPTTVGLGDPSSSSSRNDGGGGGRAALDCYFIEDDGQTFKATVEYEPYFLVAVRHGREAEAEEWLKRVPGGGDGVVRAVRRIEKDDLSVPNHLLGYRRTFLELRFANVQDLMTVRRDIMPVAERNRKAMGTVDVYAEAAA